MKFEYEPKEDDRECVAYIDVDGDLMIADESKENTICMSLKQGYCSGDTWDPSKGTHKFYPGDKLTIEF